MRYGHIVSYVVNTPWAIQPGKLSIILEVLRFHLAGGKLTPEEVQERVGAVARPSPSQAGMVQVLPLYGTIAHRMGLMTESSGGTSTERFAGSFRAALANADVSAIVIDVDSPGGTVDGVPELADLIYRSRGAKPVVAVANTLAASAAYWIGSAADELLVSPSGEVGSIGVLAAHQDLSGFYEREGVRTTLIAAGEYKAEGNPFEPLTEEARAYIQERVDDYYGMFVRAVALQRGASVDDVRKGYGQGRVMGAQPAVAAGMADRVGTLDDAIARAAQLARRGLAGRRAADAESRARLALAGL